MCSQSHYATISTIWTTRSALSRQLRVVNGPTARSRPAPDSTASGIATFIARFSEQPDGLFGVVSIVGGRGGLIGFLGEVGPEWRVCVAKPVPAGDEEQHRCGGPNPSPLHPTPLDPRHMPVSGHSPLEQYVPALATAQPFVPVMVVCSPFGVAFSWFLTLPNGRFRPRSVYTSSHLKVLGARPVVFGCAVVTRRTWSNGRGGLPSILKSLSRRQQTPVPGSSGQRRRGGVQVAWAKPN